MEPDVEQREMLPEHPASFDGLIGDQRTGVTFRETVKRIIRATTNSEWCPGGTQTTDERELGAGQWL